MARLPIGVPLGVVACNQFMILLRVLIQWSFLMGLEAKKRSERGSQPAGSHQQQLQVEKQASKP